MNEITVRKNLERLNVLDGHFILPLHVEQLLFIGRSDEFFDLLDHRPVPLVSLSVSMNRGPEYLLPIHHAQGGRYPIVLPHPVKRITELFSQRVVGENGCRFSGEFLEPDTKLSLSEE